MSNAVHEKREDHETRKVTTIIVNGRQKEVTEKELSFDDVIALAFNTLPSGPNIVFTVTYRRGEGNKPEGTMVTGDTVKIKEGMIFNVTATDKS